MQRKSKKKSISTFWIIALVVNVDTFAKPFAAGLFRAAIIRIIEARSYELSCGCEAALISLRRNRIPRLTVGSFRSAPHFASVKTANDVGPEK